jgi:hypothetical protein
MHLMIEIHVCGVDENFDSDWINIYLFLVFAQVLHTNLERDSRDKSID